MLCLCPFLLTHFLFSLCASYDNCNICCHKPPFSNCILSYRFPNGFPNVDGGLYTDFLLFEYSAHSVFFFHPITESCYLIAFSQFEFWSCFCVYQLKASLQEVCDLDDGINGHLNINFCVLVLYVQCGTECGIMCI